MDTSDEELVERCVEEIPYVTRSFEQLMRRYEATVYRSCLRYLGDSHEAEEASQDAFIRVFHGLKGFAGRSAFRTWLYRIVKNVCATRYQKIQKEAERKAAFLQQAREDEQSTYTTQMVEGIAGPIGDALARLSSDDREIITLRHVSELSVPELAEVLGTKLSATKMRLSRAEKRFREAYETITGKSGEFPSGM
ncbi:MAG: sigma-70 family RNA polymerase sigma factor [Planctomycetota bacterium]